MRYATLAVSAATTIALASSAMAGVVFNDSATDLPVGEDGLKNILSVDVSHTETSIKFRLTLNGISNPYNSNQYAIAFSTPGAATKTTAVWAHQANFESNGGMNYIVSADAWYGGASFFQSHGVSGWSDFGAGTNQNSSFSGNYDTNTLDIYVSRSAIGMAGDGTFFFDALSTNATIGSYGSNFTTNTALSYTIGAPVPAPGAIALLGAAGLLGSRRRRA